MSTVIYKVTDSNDNSILLLNSDSDKDAYIKYSGTLDDIEKEYEVELYVDYD